MTAVHLDDGDSDGEILEDAFEAAAAYVAVASSSLGKHELLDLYGYYKQANNGPCTSACPSLFDRQGRLKWGAWNKHGKLSRERAKAEYVNTLSKVAPDWAGRSDGQHVHTSSSAGPGGAVFSTLASSTEQASEGVQAVVSLHSLATSGDVAGIERLLSEGAAVDQRDEEGCCALHWAADRGHAEVVSVLVSHGGNTNVQDNDGQTPLHYAAMCEHRKVYELLLELQADPHLLDTEGQNPYDLAPNDWCIWQRTGAG